jgi:Kinesin motor domain
MSVLHIQLAGSMLANQFSWYSFSLVIHWHLSPVLSKYVWHRGHVPYRDSKLTRILQPALGGNANTAIICNVTLAQVWLKKEKIIAGKFSIYNQHCEFLYNLFFYCRYMLTRPKAVCSLRAELRVLPTVYGSMRLCSYLSSIALVLICFFQSTKKHS